MAARAIFYFDFQSPYAYLAAARIEGLIPDAEWRPIAFPILLDRLGRLEAAMGRDTTPIVAEVSERAAGRDLPPFNPPQAWPLQTWSLAPLRAALFAAGRGRLPEFSRVAFRKLFAEGRHPGATSAELPRWRAYMRWAHSRIPFSSSAARTRSSRGWWRCGCV